MIMTCLVIDDEPHAIEELTSLIAQIPHLKVVGAFSDARQAIAYLREENHVDIIFSDITMESLNGIDAAVIMNNYCHFLVFVTGHRDFAVDAFDVKADGYLMKPINYLSFRQKVEDLTAKYKDLMKLQKDEHQFLFVKGGQKSTYVKIRYTDIIHIQALLNYIVIYTLTGTEITYIGLKAIDDRLRPIEQFFRVNKSVIISVNYLDRVDGNLVRLSNGHHYQIGAKYKAVFLEFLKKHSLKSKD